MGLWLISYSVKMSPTVPALQHRSKLSVGVGALGVVGSTLQVGLVKGEAVCPGFTRLLDCFPRFAISTTGFQRFY